MEFALVLYTSKEIEKKTYLILSTSNEIKVHFKDRFYGDSIKSLLIGVICVSKEYESFFKLRKPKYTENNKSIQSEGFQYTIEKCMEYDLKLDFETFKNADEVEASKILAHEILASLVVFNKMKSKIKDFDFEKFKADLEHYFKSQDLL